jgi:hypothetical protein
MQRLVTGIARERLMTLETYSRERGEFRTRVLAHKRARTVAIGPNVTLIFEDELTVRYQIQEMLRIEKIFDEQGIQAELDAYGPLVPDGQNLKATMLIEYEDPVQRQHELVRLRGIERRVFFQVGEHPRVFGVADEDMERENETKTSAVHFLRFEFTSMEIEQFRARSRVSLGIDHPEYRHQIETLAPSTLEALVADFRKA